MKTPTSISIYGSHDASVCVKVSPSIYRIYELERITGEKHCKINTHPQFEHYMNQIAEIINKSYGLNKFNYCYYGQLPGNKIDVLRKIFNINMFEETDHHLGHAAGAYYLSGFNKSLIISSDGGGHGIDGVSSFNIYHADGNEIKKIKKIELDVTSPYTYLATCLEEIGKQGGYLTYAGKIMGMVAYGKVKKEWIEPMITYYKNRSYETGIKKMLKSLNFPVSEELSGQDAYDLAATSQYVFEKTTIETIMPYINDRQLPVCLTGGAALNVLLNQTIKESTSCPIFAPPNPSDCGLSFGFMMAKQPPSQKITSIQYSGCAILDHEKLPGFIEKYKAEKISIVRIARLIAEGKTIGTLRGNSEVGPRALGNRSILCNPAIAGMKEKLNEGIKFREWYRPYAPVVRLQDVDKYFQFIGSSPYMSFSPKVKDEWHQKAPAITHKDGTARLQTVSHEQNPFLYDLITEFEKITGIGILLNTSFNTRGKPILTTIQEALDVLHTTALDCLLVEDYMFSK